MNIKEGSYYRTRGSAIRGPMRPAGIILWTDGLGYWYGDGAYYIEPECPSLDCVSEIYVVDKIPLGPPTFKSVESPLVEVRNRIFGDLIAYHFHFGDVSDEVWNRDHIPQIKTMIARALVVADLCVEMLK